MKEFEYMIESYLDGLMPVQERDDFEKRLSKTPDLAAQLEEAQRTNQLLAAYVQVRDEKKAIQEALADLKAPVEEAKVRNLKPLRYLTAVAAAVALIVAGVWLFQPKQQNISELYAQHMVLEKSPETFGEAEVLLKKGHLLYDEKNYDAAVRVYQQAFLQVDENSRAEATFYMGLSYMSMQPPQPQRAIEALAATQGYKEMKTDWYLALAQVQAGDKVAAQKALQDIVDFPKHDFYDEARKLLNAID